MIGIKDFTQGFYMVRAQSANWLSATLPVFHRDSEQKSKPLFLSPFWSFTLKDVNNNQWQFGKFNLF
jgi:hypothetical protein